MQRAVWLTALVLTAGALHAQRPSDGPWRHFFEHEGVRFAYLFYAEADAMNNGVVVRLHNTNTYPIRYQFKIVFRSGGGEHVEEAEGYLEAGTQKTGDLDGLFWIPYSDGRLIDEIGLRGIHITRLAEATETG